MLLACIVSCAFSSSAVAEVSALSRANCLNWVNESVTWDRPGFTRYWMLTRSFHVGFGAFGGHTIKTPWAFTWRSYAGHLGDRTRNTVTGFHLFGESRESAVSVSTVATDCNLGSW